MQHATLACASYCNPGYAARRSRLDSSAKPVFTSAVEAPCWRFLLADVEMPENRFESCDLLLLALSPGAVQEYLLSFWSPLPFHLALEMDGCRSIEIQRQWGYMWGVCGVELEGPI